MASLVYLISPTTTVHEARTFLDRELTLTNSIRVKNSRMIAQSLIQQARTALTNTFTTTPEKGIVLYFLNDGSVPKCIEATKVIEKSYYSYGAENHKEIIFSYL
jgi:hypothetical protein